MSTSTAAASSVGSLAFVSKVEVDPQSLLLMARQQRVALIQSQLDATADELRSCLDQRKDLCAFSSKVEAFQKGNPNEGDISPFLAKLGAAERERLRAYCTDDKGVFHADRLSDARSTDEDWEKFASQANEETANLDLRIESLKSDLRELSSSLDYEMKAMQRSVRGEQRTRQSIATAGG